MTGVKFKERRTSRNSRLWRIETADSADDRTRNESRKAAEAYRELLIAAGHLPATEANDRG